MTPYESMLSQLSCVGLDHNRVHAYQEVLFVKRLQVKGPSIRQYEERWQSLHQV